MVSQIVEQAPVTQLGQKGERQRTGQQDRAAGFDELLQQKRQTSDEPPKAQSGRPAQRKDGAGETQAPEEAVTRQCAEEDEEIPDDAKALLAAMMLQPQPEAAVQAGPEVQPEEAVQAVEITAEAAQAQELATETAPEAAETATVPAAEAPEGQPVRQAETREAAEAPEAAEQPRQELQQSEVVTRAPEAAETQPRQTRDSGGQRQVQGAETVERPQETEEDQAPAEAPLFQPETVADAAPVKVADPAPARTGEPVPLESPDAPQNIVQRMLDNLREGDTLCVIQFEPAELGSVRMSIVKGTDGTLGVLMEATNAKTVPLLEKHSGELLNILRESLHEESVHLEIRHEPENMGLHDEQREQQHQQEQQGRSRREQDEANDELMDDFLQRLRLGLIGAEDGGE